MGQVWSVGGDGLRLGAMRGAKGGEHCFDLCRPSLFLTSSLVAFLSISCLFVSLCLLLFRIYNSLPSYSAPFGLKIQLFTSSACPLIHRPPALFPPPFLLTSIFHLPQGNSVSYQRENRTHHHIAPLLASPSTSPV